MPLAAFGRGNAAIVKLRQRPKTAAGVSNASAMALLLTADQYSVRAVVCQNEPAEPFDHETQFQ